MSGLLISGSLVQIPGLRMVAPAGYGGPAWATLTTDDYRSRPSSWIRQVIIHTTKGIWPQREISGAGPGGSGKVVADFWRGDPAHSAAQIVVDTDGTVVCLADLARSAAYHAEGSNPWSIGIEMYQLGDGGIYSATLDATATIVAALTMSGLPGRTGLFQIPAQMPRGPYRSAPLLRMESGSGSARRNFGGPNLVGVFGHRDNTSQRGRGDPGDLIFGRLAALGFEGMDYDGNEDLSRGVERQQALNAHDDAAGHKGPRLTIDGVFGPASAAAMARHGFKRWRDVA